MAGTARHDVAGMFIQIHADRADDVHEPVPERDLLIRLDDLVDAPIELPVEKDVDRHAMDAHAGLLTKRFGWRRAEQIASVHRTLWRGLA